MWFAMSFFYHKKREKLDSTDPKLFSICVAFLLQKYSTVVFIREDSVVCQLCFHKNKPTSPAIVISGGHYPLFLVFTHVLPPHSNRNQDENNPLVFTMSAFFSPRVRAGHL